MRLKLKHFVPAIFFVAGVTLDWFTLNRIDHKLTLAKHGCFLICISVILALEVIFTFKPLPENEKFKKIWKFNSELSHFLLGGLLSAYAIFYFKSSSLITSWIFLLVLVVFMVMNSFSRAQSRGIFMRFLLLSLCFVSYSNYLIPILLRSIGHRQFILSVGISIGLMLLFVGIILTTVRERKFIGKNVLVPVLTVHLVFSALYALQFIPPVPLSIQHIGIYHQIEKENGNYKLFHLKPWWRFWQFSDQVFEAREGDRLYCFARIFSPTDFHENIKMHWLHWQKKNGWMTWDKIPFEVKGGRKEGFRGVAFKEHYVSGRWQIRIETNDGREIGRIYFVIKEDSSLEERRFHVTLQ